MFNRYVNLLGQKLSLFVHSLSVDVSFSSLFRCVVLEYEIFFLSFTKTSVIFPLIQKFPSEQEKVILLFNYS